jgi:hypothetical protein
MHALVRFAQIPAAGTFSTAEIYPHTVAALGATTQRYSLASLRYDLSKLRIKGLVEKLPRSRRYRLSPQGYSICLIFLKLFERVYAPLSAARLDPVPGDASLPPHKNTLLDRLYSRLNAALDRLLHASGLASSPQTNENKILVVVESPGGLSPPGAPRSVREPLDSYGSRCSAVSMAELPVGKERWICSA